MLGELLVLLVRGLGLGAVYAMIGMSFTVVYGSSRILNFAQGNFLVLGGIAAAALFGVHPAPLSWLLMLPVAAAAIAALMVAQGAVTLYPLRASGEQDSWVITTMAASVIIGALVLLSRGPFSTAAASPFPSFSVLGMSTPAPYAVAMVLAVLWYGGLRWFMSGTSTGLAISAISQDLDAARAAGLRVRRLQLIAFGISGLLIGSAGYVAAPLFAISGDGGFSFVIDGFAALIIGGLGSLTGAAVGGLVLGVVGMVATYLLGGEFRGLVILLLLAAVLTGYPQGLFGFAKARTV